MHKKEFYKYKLLKSVFSFGMAVISFGLFVFLVFILSDLMKKNLSEIPFWIFFLCLCILSIYGISGGVEARARMFEFLFPWIWIPFVLMMVFGAFAIKPDFFYLPYVPSIKNVTGIKTSVARKKRAPLNVKGPMYSMPTRCATKATPQIKAVSKRRPLASIRLFLT